ncbi:unnamed protein product [Paramecium pentaurelia]|uniref:PX domain-containing protein n=1 Tax=Paramecium pentaurelia TaxID=43138 RepID=A0A8S1XM24_9CILI|nr:unnamed protein product [Paramecium pentaurelia]
MKLELDQKNKYLEQIISLKQERYHHNRKELLIKKAKQQYLCEYYNSQLSSKPIQTRQTQYKNTSFHDFQQTKTYVRNAQSQPRKQSFFNIQYQKKINEIEKRVHVMQRKLKLGNLDSQIIPNDYPTLTYISQIFIFKQNCKSFLPKTMISAHLHVGQSQPHTSEAPVLQFLGKSKKRKRRSLDTNDWISLHDHKIKGNSHTQYLIRLKVDNVVWSFWTRYSMLSELHQTLDEVIKSQLPTFPEKRLFGNLNPNFIQTRKSQLDIYLQALFKDPYVRDSKVFQDFITNSKQKAFKKADLDSLHRFKLDHLSIQYQFQIKFNLPSSIILTYKKPVNLFKPNLENKDNQTKRIVIATVLSIFLIVVLCVIIQFILDIAKQSNIQLSIEKKSNLSD